MGRERELHDDRRMSDAEALMWNLEKDPHLASSFANVSLLDTEPDLDRLRMRMAAAVESIPRLRQRVVPALGRLAPPEWQEDPDFDLDYHVSEVALPGPGSVRQLLDLTSDVVARPFDRTRPLWEFVVVMGMEGGRAALVQKLHHTITDGEGGIRMSEQFIDIARDAAEPITPARPVPPTEARSFSETTVDTLTHRVRRGVGIVRRTAEEGVGLLADPRRIPPFVMDLADMARSALQQLTVTDPARSPLWHDRSLRRHLEILQVPFDDAKQAASALGGSLNDFFVAGAAGGAAAYHAAAGVPIEDLRMAMPVSTRSDASAGGNAFSLTRVLLPVADEDRRTRFAAIQARLTATKRDKALNLVSGVAGLANLLPTSVAVRVARQQVETVDFTTSNVRGAPFPLYIAGARILGNHPVGPLGGTAWNLTVMTYDGHLDMGLHVDLGAVPDPEVLREAIEAEYAALIEASRRPAKKPRAKKPAAKKPAAKKAAGATKPKTAKGA